MYEMSEIKDISIKGVERIMKISAWDCALNYDRTMTQAIMENVNVNIWTVITFVMEFLPNC